MQAFQILNDFNKSWNGGGQRYLVTNGMCAQSLSCVQLFVAPWTEARQAPLSMEFPRQEYRSGLLFPLPEDLPDTRIEALSPALASTSPCTGRRILYH